MADEIAAPAAPAVDPGTTSNPPPSSDDLARITKASDAAIGAHATEFKRRPGQRGPDKKPRARKVPVEFMGDGTASPLVPPEQAVPDSPDWSEPPPAAIDDETAKALAEVAVELFKDGRESFVRLMALKITGDKAVADATVQPMSEKLDRAMNRSGVALAKKYGAEIEYAPEITFFGAMLVCLGGDLVKLRMLRGETNRFKGAA